MIIISGKIYVRSGTREALLASSREAIIAARKAPGCQDFVVAADPLEPERINIYEVWDSEKELLAFRGDGPDQSMTSVIVKADVHKHDVAASGPA